MVITNGNIKRYVPVDIHEKIVGDKYIQYYIEEEGKKIYLNEDFYNNRTQIIRVKDEQFTIYYDMEKRRMYVDPDVGNPENVPRYKGISNRTLNKITNVVGWNNYRIFNYYYDYGESVLCLEMCQSNFDPQDLTDQEMDYLSKKLINHIFQSQGLMSELCDGFDTEIETRCRQVRENIELRYEQFETKLISTVRIMLEKEHEVTQENDCEE